MIHCVWYPSGGFGHFINAVLTLHGKDFVRPQKSFEFSANGNSHQLELVAPKYLHDPLQYTFNFDKDKTYSVLIDNGINNEGTKFKQVFPNANVIKMCYSNFSWPVVANTLIVKAMGSSLDINLAVDPNKWNTNAPLAQREKYFLFLRDHILRHAWKPDLLSSSIMIEDLLDYNTLRQRIGLDLNDFELFYNKWWESNRQYFLPVLTAQKILQGQFETVTDTWTQAIVYYQIWCKYNVEVAHNDYSNWFESYEDIVTMLDKHGVSIDPI